MKKKLFEHIGGHKFKIVESTSDTYDTVINDPETDEEIEVTVEYDYHKASRGARERGTGLQLEPDEPASIEIYSVKDANGKEYELSRSEYERIENAIIDDINDRAADYDYDPYDRDYDPYDR